ncbi:PREDICTED: probable tRNA pseudouridine synthase 2 [Ceratosolen solmsi marchali]|uniref:Probable tRNA pseudouridine synthase 2 n=1 Tax=Ceratosolen solmsi marchali TaxID=326594 RepID=A0AAJ7E2W8_9HYME|nr:PREDICTED: probable tRNA pseudouridine synthase 2 [Ceratosolen solmsi marchali]
MGKLIKDAHSVWNTLNGIFLVFKPAGIHYLGTLNTLNLNLQRDFNKLEVRPPMKYVSIEGPTNKEMRVVVRDSYADNPLVVGPRFREKNFRMVTVNNLDIDTSGVLVVAINYGTRLRYVFKEFRPTVLYKVKGILGQMRRNNFMDGAIVEKSTWKHIRREHIDRVCASMQASHQKMMFQLSGLDIQSQEAYELAVKGPIRPNDPNIPLLYSIKCINFTPPEFTLEIVCINTSSEYLKSVTAEIGIKLHSTAHCNYLHCSQYGLFHVKDSLLSKHWNLSNILNNMNMCQNLISKHSSILSEKQPNLAMQIAT